VISVHSCPHCSREFKTIGGRDDHVLGEHSEAVLAHWIDEYDVSPIRSGQRSLPGAVV